VVGELFQCEKCKARAGREGFAPSSGDAPPPCPCGGRTERVSCLPARIHPHDARGEADAQGFAALRSSPTSPPDVAAWLRDLRDRVAVNGLRWPRDNVVREVARAFEIDTHVVPKLGADGMVWFWYRFTTPPAHARDYPRTIPHEPRLTPTALAALGGNRSIGRDMPWDDPDEVGT